MPSVLQLQEAKARFSEVVTAAMNGEPQIITKHGKEAAVVISCADFRRLTHQEGNLVAFLLTSPLMGSGIDLTREDSAPRKDIDL
jgi:prevent-host-death family protein